jgi:hypothetical protein
MALQLTQPLTEISTRNLPGGKGQLAHTADDLTTICEPTVYEIWEPKVSQPHGPPQPVTGTSFSISFHLTVCTFVIITMLLNL